MLLREPIKIENKAVLKIVFEVYYKALVNFATQYLNSIEKAKDEVQDVFISLWNKKMFFENEKALRAYLYTAVKNKCFNKIKHEQVKKDFAKENKSSEIDEEATNKAVYKEEVTRQLYTAISKLTTRQQEIIKLSLKGFANDVIATRLAIKIQTVKTIKSQAYEMLRSYFSDNN